MFGNDDVAYRLTLDFQLPVIRCRLPDKCELPGDLTSAEDLLSFGDYALVPVFRFFRMAAPPENVNLNLVAANGV